MKNPCIVCEWDEAYSRGLCKTCHERFRRRGALDAYALPSIQGKQPERLAIDGWLNVGMWVSEMEPDIWGKKLFGKVMKVHTSEGEKWANVKLAYTGATVPLRVSTLCEYTGEIPVQLAPGKVAKMDMRQILGLSEAKA